jgi:hypothetical protein
MDDALVIFPSALSFRLQAYLDSRVLPFSILAISASDTSINDGVNFST